MNIAIGKISKSLRFDKEYRKAGKGDLAPMASYITLAKNYPQHTFYIIGLSDLYKSGDTKEKRAENEVPENIVDLGYIAKENSKKAKKPDAKTVGFQLFNKSDVKYHEHFCEYVIDVIKEKNITFDYGIFFIGPDFSTSTPFIYNQDLYAKTGEKKVTKILDCDDRYAAPIVHALNTFKFPYILVNEDPRYVPTVISDLMHTETCILSHLNAECEVKKFQGYFDDSLKPKTKHIENFIYSGIERTSLLFLKKYDFRDKDDFVVEGKHYKKDGFIFVACNESPSRFSNIKSWILDQFPDVKIYGKWKDTTIKGYENRFENKPMAYLQDELWKAKYTYIPGFFDSMTNFVTIKIWEMCIYGILPFFDRSKYDTDNLVNVPEFLRCSSPEDMKSKIEQLEKDPDLYQKYLNDIYELVSDDYFNGKFISKIFSPIFEKDPKTLTLEDWRKNADSLMKAY